MPAITVEAAKLTKEQKTQLIAELTESASKILRLPKDIIFVFLKENDPDNIGASGLPLSAHKKTARAVKNTRAPQHTTGRRAKPPALNFANARDIGCNRNALRGAQTQRLGDGVLPMTPRRRRAQGRLAALREIRHGE